MEGTETRHPHKQTARLSQKGKVMKVDDEVARAQPGFFSNVLVLPEHAFTPHEVAGNSEITSTSRSRRRAWTENA